MKIQFGKFQLLQMLRGEKLLETEKNYYVLEKDLSYMSKIIFTFSEMSEEILG